MTDFFDLRGTHNPHRWFLPVTDEIAAGPSATRFMFGGVGLAAAIEAMERTCDRPVIWATAQYLSFARPGTVVDFDVSVPSAGRHTSQARVVGHIDDKAILMVNAALGQRPGEIAEQWVEMPDVPGPEQCAPPRTILRPFGFGRRFEQRIARGPQPDYRGPAVRDPHGRLSMWVRSRGGEPMDSAMLAIVADFVSRAIAPVLGRNAGGNSLDNTIRFGPIEPTEWVLCDIGIEMIHAGVVHGVMHIFSPRGTLMATASQSLILRLRPPPDEDED